MTAQGLEVRNPTVGELTADGIEVWIVYRQNTTQGQLFRAEKGDATFEAAGLVAVREMIQRAEPEAVLILRHRDDSPDIVEFWV